MWASWHHPASRAGFTTCRLYPPASRRPAPYTTPPLRSGAGVGRRWRQLGPEQRLRLGVQRFQIAGIAIVVAQRASRSASAWARPPGWRAPSAAFAGFCGAPPAHPAPLLKAVWIANWYCASAWRCARWRRPPRRQFCQSQTAARQIGGKAPGGGRAVEQIVQRHAFRAQQAGQRDAGQETARATPMRALAATRFCSAARQVRAAGEQVEGSQWHLAGGAVSAPIVLVAQQAAGNDVARAAPPAPPARFGLFACCASAGTAAAATAASACAWR